MIMKFVCLRLFYCVCSRHFVDIGSILLKKIQTKVVLIINANMYSADHMAIAQCI